MSAKIILFEDSPEIRQKITGAIKSAAKKEKIDLIPFVANENITGKTYEDILLAGLLSAKYKNSELIICDRDLSMTDGLKGLSETAVSSAATRVGIPVCLYIGGGNADDFFSRRREWGDGRIVLKKPPLNAVDALETIILVKGFIEIKKRFGVVMSKKNKAKTPAEFLSNILGHPEVTSQIAQYGFGDQKMLLEVLPMPGQKIDRTFTNRIIGKMPCVLGYWLYNSLLRFPGILVNKIAAASYLNIDPKDFENPKVMSLFKSASYEGPFSNQDTPFWWKHLLDEILFKAKCNSGFELVGRKIKALKIKKCFCSVDSSKPAGYYCVVTQKPISLENSEGNISWFPKGASLARISKKEYDQIGPWVGLF